MSNSEMKRKGLDSTAVDTKTNSEDHSHTHGQNETWHNLCDNTTVKDFVKTKHRKLVTIDKHASVRQALKVLNRENILSAPIVDHKEKSFLGFVDVLDIAGFVLATWRQQSHHLDNAHFPGEKFFDSNIMNVLNFSEVDYPVYINQSKCISDLIDLFRNPKNFYRLHRVAVTDDEHNVINVVTQSDIVNFAAAHLEEFDKEKLNIKIGLMQGLIRSPIMITIDSAFVDALERLYKNRISGLALVDHEFKLSGNLSASDLRGITPDGFDFFFGSTLQFLAKGTSSKPKRSMQVGTGNTFGEVIQMLSSEKIHRIYITTEHGHPVGFVSLIDVIARM